MTYSDHSESGFELLDSLHVVIDQTEACALATSECGVEAVDDDRVLVLWGCGVMCCVGCGEMNVWIKGLQETMLKI